MYTLWTVERLLVPLAVIPPLWHQGFQRAFPNTTCPHVVEEQGSRCAMLGRVLVCDQYLVLLTSESAYILEAAESCWRSTGHFKASAAYIVLQATAVTERSQDQAPYRSNVSGCSGAGPCSHSVQGRIVVERSNGNRRQNRLTAHEGPGSRA